MMTDPAVRPNSIPWPPLIYVTAAVIGIIANWYCPLPWPGGLTQMALAAAGLWLVGAGVTLELVTVLAFRRHRTTILPNRGATALITGGPFAMSRNPIYLGNTLLLTGVGLLTGIAWLLPAALGAAFVTQKLAIEREEAHLALRFGQAWADYAARTPRWLFVL